MLSGRARAQIDPDDTGEGVRLGLAAQNNSGQVGTVELFKNGSEGTLVIVRVFSVPQRAIESARIAWARSCDAAEARRTLALAAVRDGVSHGVVPLPLNRLLAGGAIVEVFRSGRRALERVSCGELRR